MVLEALRQTKFSVDTEAGKTELRPVVPSVA